MSECNKIILPPGVNGRNLIEVLLTDCESRLNPRSFRPHEYIEALSKNIEANGLQVPILGWFTGKRFQVEDGGCRLAAFKLLNRSTIPAMDLGHEPTTVEILLAQASIDLHKQHLPPVDRARLFQGIMAEQHWNGQQTAEHLGVSASLLSRYLSLLILCEDLQAAVNEGKLEWTKGSRIALETNDPDRQRELAKAAMGMTRDAFAATLRKKSTSDTPAVRVQRIAAPLPSGAKVVISGPEMSLEEAIGAASEFIREAKKAKEQALDVKTFMRVCVDKARANGKGAAGAQPSLSE